MRSRSFVRFWFLLSVSLSVAFAGAEPPENAAEPTEEPTSAITRSGDCPGPFRVGRGYVFYIATRTVRQKAFEQPTTRYEVTECRGSWVKVVDWTGEPHEPGYGTRWVNTTQATWVTELSQ